MLAIMSFSTVLWDRILPATTQRLRIGTDFLGIDSSWIFKGIKAMQG
jgi:hypothetical protein